jgi:hypothetical protein
VVALEHKTGKNHIQEYLIDTANGNVTASKELFSDEKIKVKSEASGEEITLLAKLHYNDLTLKDAGLDTLYDGFIQELLTLRVSKERKSRGEFVNINTQDNTDKDVEKFSQFTNILGGNVRK